MKVVSVAMLIPSGGIHLDGDLKRHEDPFEWRRRDLIAAPSIANMARPTARREGDEVEADLGVLECRPSRRDGLGGPAQALPLAPGDRIQGGGDDRCDA